MQIQLNGEPREIPDGLTVTGLLAHLEVRAEKVAVQLNLDVVRRAEHDQTRLKPHDRVEIVTFVGGG